MNNHIPKRYALSNRKGGTMNRKDERLLGLWFWGFVLYLIGFGIAIGWMVK